MVARSAIDTGGALPMAQLKYPYDSGKNHNDYTGSYGENVPVVGEMTPSFSTMVLALMAIAVIAGTYLHPDNRVKRK